MLPPDETETPTEPEAQPEEADEPKPEPEEEKPAEEPDTEEAEPEGEEEGEEKPEGDVDPDAKSPDEAAAGDKRKPRRERDRARGGGFQRTIEQLRRQNAILVEQLAAGRPPPTAKPDKEKTPEEKTADYIEGLVERRLEAREAQKQQQTVVTEFQRRTAEVRSKHDDFDDVVGYADIPVTSGLGQALLTSEHGPAIMYQLAKSPAELARVSALPPLDAAREVGRLEAKLASASPSAKPSKTALRLPAPPTSVRGSSPSTRSLEDLPLSEYKRAMRSRQR